MPIASNLLKAVAYTALFLLMLLNLSELLARVIPIPPPLVQIAAEVIWARPSLGWRVELGPR